ncbi:hypothetical protein DSO57_1027835 [Entomophthora muscae]|uniref:Uncharacterized protein n=1 Tax=Entomophthora muscae TaxID=34485 RepID=A0ACC2RSM6_9FUNG|nr:hypothetical protein DSO57_1027835 [Entomophthora muscae]
MSQANIAHVPSPSVEGKRLVSTPEGKNIKWWVTQYEKFFVQYFIHQEDMKPAKWHGMVLEFNSWDKWKPLATKRFGNTHMDIVKKLEMIHIQDYKTIEEFIDAYHVLVCLKVFERLI